MTDVMPERDETALPATDAGGNPDGMVALTGDLPARQGRIRGVARVLRAAYTGAFVDDWSPRRWMRARVSGLLFLGFLAFPVKETLGASWSLPDKVLIFVGLTLLAACFAAVIWRNTPLLHANRAPYALSGAIVVGSLLLIPFGQQWLPALSYFTMSMLLFNCRTSRWPLIVLGVPLADVVIGRFAFDGATAKPFMVALQVLLIGAIQAAFYQQIAAKTELRRVRADLARLAVSEERLRIARDLHDILGQRLSAVSLKAELAARLAGRDAVRASAEMVEVAAVARAALADVRLTVSGYRQMSLTGEIETARALLTAGGVSLDASMDALPASLDECGGWLVREAVTNVIRHSSASVCQIRATRKSGAVVVEVRDNGRTDGAFHAYGNGLTGLAERVGCVGGDLWTGRDHGWFVVRATFAEAAVRGAAARTAVAQRHGVDEYVCAPNVAT
jgi:two-component system sensor histidine kinase DesK